MGAILKKIALRPRCEYDFVRSEGKLLSSENKELISDGIILFFRAILKKMAILNM